MDSHQSDEPGFKISENRQRLIQSPSRKERLGDPGDESISDEENDAVSKFLFTSGAVESPRSYYRNFESENHNETCSWSAILEEADGLVCTQKKTYNSSFISGISQVKKIRRGGRGGAKLKFCIRPQSHKVEEAAEGLAGLEHISVENSVADLLGNLHEEIDEFPSKLVFNEQRSAMPSVAELLEDLQEKNVSSNGPSNLLLQNVKAKERKTQFSGKRMVSSLGTRILDNEDPPEFTGGGISSEDEAVDQNNLSCAAEKIKGHTMTDLFHEAFSISKAEEFLRPTSKQARSGCHGRLQQVLQIEKERHLEFLKKLQTRCSPVESRCIDVRILSRFLEAKLTVCHCLFGENIKQVIVDVAAG